MKNYVMVTSPYIEVTNTLYYSCSKSCPFYLCYVMPLSKTIELSMVTLVDLRTCISGVLGQSKKHPLNLIISSILSTICNTLLRDSKLSLQEIQDLGVQKPYLNSVHQKSQLSFVRNQYMVQVSLKGLMDFSHQQTFE